MEGSFSFEVEIYLKNKNFLLKAVGPWMQEIALTEMVFWFPSFFKTSEGLY